MIYDAGTCSGGRGAGGERGHRRRSRARTPAERRAGRGGLRRRRRCLAGSRQRNVRVMVVDLDRYGVGLVRDLATVFPGVRIIALTNDPRRRNAGDPRRRRDHSAALDAAEGVGQADRAARAPLALLGKSRLDGERAGTTSNATPIARRRAPSRSVRSRGRRAKRRAALRRGPRRASPTPPRAVRRAPRTPQRRARTRSPRLVPTAR